MNRESYDYRANYIKHNPGILKNIYICSQCGKLIIRKNMEVDHIIPISRWYSPNRVFNCCAICSKCNKIKSDKIGMCTMRGIIAKLFEEILLIIHRVLLAVLILLMLYSGR